MSGKYPSKDHLTACQSCGTDDVPSMSGSDEDLRYIDLNGWSFKGDNRIYLCDSLRG